MHEVGILELGNTIVFLLKAIIFGLAAVVVIPKEQYKKFFIYGFIFGGVGDTIFIFIFGKTLHLIQYMNMGPFAALGMYPFWTPVSWSFALMLFSTYYQLSVLTSTCISWASPFSGIWSARYWRALACIDISG